MNCRSRVGRRMELSRSGCEQVRNGSEKLRAAEITAAQGVWALGAARGAAREELCAPPPPTPVILQPLWRFNF